MQFGAADVHLAVERPALIVLEIPVAAEDGKYLGDALKYLDYALKAWERIIDRAERAV